MFQLRVINTGIGGYGKPGRKHRPRLGRHRIESEKGLTDIGRDADRQHRDLEASDGKSVSFCFRRTVCRRHPHDHSESVEHIVVEPVIFVGYMEGFIRAEADIDVFKPRGCEDGLKVIQCCFDFLGRFPPRGGDRR